MKAALVLWMAMLVASAQQLTIKPRGPFMDVSWDAPFGNYMLQTNCGIGWGNYRLVKQREPFTNVTVAALHPYPYTMFRVTAPLPVVFLVVVPQGATNEEITVPIYAIEFTNVTAMQFPITWDWGITLLGMTNAVPWLENTYTINENSVSISWTNTTARTLDYYTPIYYLKYRVTFPGLDSVILGPMTVYAPASTPRQHEAWYQYTPKAP